MQVLPYKREKEMTIQDYAREVDQQDKLQQEYFKKKRQGSTIRIFSLEVRTRKPK